MLPEPVISPRPQALLKLATAPLLGFALALNLSALRADTANGEALIGQPWDDIVEQARGSEINDTVEAVNIVLSEKQAGVDDKGSVDMIWINGKSPRNSYCPIGCRFHQDSATRLISARSWAKAFLMLPSNKKEKIDIRRAPSESGW